MCQTLDGDFSVFSIQLIDLWPYIAALVTAGAVAGFLAGLFGIGGGAILVPVFYQMFAGLGIDEAVRMHLSVGTSLAIIVPTSLRSFSKHRASGAVDMELLRSYLFAVPLGVICAALVAAFISGAGLRIIFAIIALLLAVKLLFAKKDWRIGDDLPGGMARIFAGWLIGFFSTFMGIGGGVMNNSFMTAYGRSMHQAVATSSGVGVLIALPGVIGMIWAGWGEGGMPPFALGYVNLLTFALIIPITLVMAPLGVKLAHQLSRRQLEIGFGLFLIVVALRFFISLL